MTEFSQRLAALLRKRVGEGVYSSQSDLARHLGIQPRRLQHYIAGRSEPDFPQTKRLCEALGTHPNYLLGYSVNPEPRYVDSVSKITELQHELAELRKTVQRLIDDKTLRVIK